MRLEIFGSPKLQSLNHGVVVVVIMVIHHHKAVVGDERKIT